MTASRDPDRLIHTFLFEGEEQLHDQIYDAVRAEIEHKRQRAVVGPWRMPIMNKLVPIGLGAAAVVGVLLIGSQLLGPPSGPGGQTIEPSPSPTATVAAPSPSPTPSPPPPLTQTFTSQMHGFSVSYPEGWIARAATEPWTDRPGVPQFADPSFDVLHDPVLTDHLFLNFTSRRIGDSTPEEWVAAQMAGDDRCTTTEPIAVDGATGLIGGEGCDVAVVTTDGRGYSIALFTSDDDPDVVAPYDRAWFEEVLATVQLHPEDAVDVAPSASP
jgi:hypothetical protein